MPLPLPFPFPTRRTGGFSLVELMVSMAIGLVLLLGMTGMFVNNSKNQAELDKSNRQTESGRYSIQLLTDDIFNAGYYAEFDPTPLTEPASMPPLCDVSVTSLRAALVAPVQGLDDSASDASCLTDAKTDSDVLVVRRVETCIAGEGNCAPASSGGAFFQASLCMNANELGSGDATKHFALDSTVADLNRHKRDCTEGAAGTPADIRRYVTHMYYVANNHNAGDGIPTLMRATLGGATALGFTIEPIAEGIESLQVEYGVDGDGNGAPDVYTTAPTAVADMRAVVAVKLHLLSRNTEKSRFHIDENTYKLGLDSMGEPKVPTITDKNYKRNVFSTTVIVANTAGRRSN